MIIGTAGHIDHGKTALVRALTGVDTDRLKEEKARGISIELGFAYVAGPDGAVHGFVDVPGHERFVHTMLAGATGIDAALLVVAADDGVMPQTREHLAILDLLGVTRGVVALSKCDLVSAPRRAEAAAEVAAALAGTGLAGAEIVGVSSVTGEGLHHLRACLFALAATPEARRADARFRLAVDRSFTLAGAGTVVTGTVLSGEVAVGDRVTVSPRGLVARVRSIHAQGRPAARGRAGERCALNLAGEGVGKAAVRRGDVVLEPLLHAPADRIDATLRVLASETKAVPSWLPVRLHHAAADVAARVVPLQDTPIPPGGEGRVQLVLEAPLAAAVGDRFILRDTSAQRTIGGGTFLDLRAPQRRRRTPARLAALAAHSLAEPEDALAALLDGPPFHLDLAAFARDRALREETLDAILARLRVVRIGLVGVADATWTRLRQSLRAALAEFHAAHPEQLGFPADRLRLLVEPRLPPETFKAALARLASEGDLRLEGALVRDAQHAARLAPSEAALWQRVRPLISGAARMRPPRVGELAETLRTPEADVRRLMKTLARLGQVNEVAPDHFFSRTALAEIVGVATDIAAGAPKGEFSAAQLRDRLDAGRKIAIQLLEFFDRHGVTLRRGDLRRMNPARLALFGPRPQPSKGEPSGGEGFPVKAADFKSVRGREPVLGGFDSHSLPPAPAARPRIVLEPRRSRPPRA